MEIGILFAALFLDNDTENTSIMQINLVERCDRLMLTILLSNFKAKSHFSLIFVSTQIYQYALKSKVNRKRNFIIFTYMSILC